MTTRNQEKDKRLHPEQLRFKGDMVVDDQEEQADYNVHLKDSVDDVKNNPYKTPPNSLTSKNKTRAKD